MPSYEADEAETIYAAYPSCDVIEYLRPQVFVTLLMAHFFSLFFSKSPGLEYCCS